MLSTALARQTPGRAKNGGLSYSAGRLALVGLIHAALTVAAPISSAFTTAKEHHHSDVPDEPRSADDAALWIYLSVAIVLVLLGGAFAGLTIALMGQDELYLQVIAESGETAEKKAAKKVLKLLKNGKHWVLVTLLVGNVITNETLPIVLDRSIGGGYAAAISSTVLVIIFGEIVPQSICVRFGLPIGAACSTFVLVLMWIFAPISWPVAKLLDYLLGEDHGTTYKKAGLKTLVTLHQQLEDGENEGLNEDEVSIISGVLDLKAKPVGSIMTPMSDVFTLSSDACLDEDLMDEIMREGYSRIPIHQPHNKYDFVGMLLVKMLITYDPEDHKHVHEFSLATLPETSPETSCLDIINFFQEGKSHMVLVSDNPGDNHGALGVVTLEDVIEELIGEEIVDESDVFQDVHKAIRRITPAPMHMHKARGVSKADIAAEMQNGHANDGGEETETDVESREESTETQPLLRPDTADPNRQSHRQSAVSLGDNRAGRTATFLMRRKSSGSGSVGVRSVQMNKFHPDMREQLKNLGPSNLASRPKQTRVNTIRIKPGVPTIPEHGKPKDEIVVPPPTNAQHGIGEGVINPGFQASDAVTAKANGYGSMDKPSYFDDAAPAEGGITNTDGPSDAVNTLNEQVVEAHERSDLPQGFPESHAVDGDMLPELPEKMIFGRVKSNESDSGSVVGSLPSGASSPKHVSHSSKEKRRQHGTARSGSITESVVDAGGVKKLVLETGPRIEEETSRSSSSAIAETNEGSSGNVTGSEERKDSTANGSSTPKPKSKKKKKKSKKNSVSA